MITRTKTSSLALIFAMIVLQNCSAEKLITSSVEMQKENNLSTLSSSNYDLSEENGRKKIEEKINEKTQKKADYLENLIENVNSSRSFKQLAQYNPEWQLFTLSFTAYAFTNLAYIDSTYHTKSIKVIDKSIENALNRKNNLSRSLNQKTGEINKNASVIYLGHLNMMLGAYKLLSNDNKYIELNKSITMYLSNEIQKSKFKNIESYPNHIWPADNIPALASIKLYDMSNNTEYSKVTKEWVNWIKTNFLDKETGLMNSQIDPKTGKSLDGPRGCSISWIMLFGHIFDKNFAEEQYVQFKKHHYDNFLGLGIGVFKERKGEWQTSSGDIDSGPLIMGYGVSATAFGLGAARIMGDSKVYNQIHNTINLTKSQFKEIEDKNGLHYELFSPLSDAAMLFTDTMTNWDTRYLK